MRLPRLPHGQLLQNPEALEGLRRDESHLVGLPPLALARPAHPDDLRELVRWAEGEGGALVPRGAGTGKAGGCLPGPGTVVVDLSAWPGQPEVDPRGPHLRAPAGCLLRDVKAAAEAAGLFYPPDPNSWDQCGFGGSLATNAGGPGACKYGMTRAWVLSLEALMADGEVHRFGIGTVKQNSGPALAQLLVGSEGIFGLIMAATVRLIPEPRERLTLLLPVGDWQGLLDLPVALVTAGLLPAAFEFWDPAVLELLRRHGPEEARRLPGEALALLEFDDPGCTSDPFLNRVLEALGPAGEHLQSATETRQREALWAVRRQTSVVLKERFPRKVSEDIVVPRTALRAFYQGVAQRGLPLVSYGHLGDGNLHVNFLAAGETEPGVLEGQVMDLFRLCMDLGGGLTGEHGIGLAKRPAFLGLADPYQIETLRSLKRALDPKGIFNPGKVI
ncbi:MAG: putative FAD-linked oxidoreductase [Acidobacteria bacterium ADurb.Bin340]|nr:MAG: putative FAD-linked oxidoreductase [Acidobacteria bacterium ADurb.Bin340]